MNQLKFSRRPIERPRKYSEVNLANQLLVLDCLMDGYSNQEIAKALNICPRTVKHYIARIANRLQIPQDKFIVRNRIVYLTAIQRGLITPYETNCSSNHHGAALLNTRRARAAYRGPTVVPINTEANRTEERASH